MDVHGEAPAAGAGATGSAAGTLADPPPPAEHSVAQYQADTDASLRAAHATVFAAAFAPSTTVPTHCAAATSTGDVLVWNFSLSQSAEFARRPPRPAAALHGHDGAAYAMCFAQSPSTHKPVVVTGGDTELRVWDWAPLLARAEEAADGGAYARNSDAVIVDPGTALVASFENPRAKGKRETLAPLSETNGLAFARSSGRLYSAAGDNCAYAWDLATGTVTATFKGHTDYLQDVCVMERSQLLATASEDGTVKLWDTRSQELVRTLDMPAPPAAGGGAAAAPASGSEASGDRPWVGAVDVDESENWLVCGGGSGMLASFHVVSGTLTASYTCDSDIHTVTFGEDEVLAGAGGGHVYRWSHSRGALLGKISTTAAPVYAVACSPVPGDKTMLTSGAGSYVDVYIEPCSRSFSLGVL